MDDVQPNEASSKADRDGGRVPRIVISGRFTPGTVVLRANRAQRVVFRREETATCSAHVVFPSLGRSVALPPFEDVVVELPALAPGSYAFTCHRAALHGRIVALSDTKPPVD